MERPVNHGLANSVTSGISQVLQDSDDVIVLEDDLVTSRYFLTYMNAALARFEDEKRIWHVSGWNYPIERAGLPDVFLWRCMNCWGWGTWRDRWAHFRPKNYSALNWSRADVARFNIDGAHNFYSQILQNRRGNLDTWATFWYACIFENGGLCANPTISYVSNIGTDGSGTNQTATDVYRGDLAGEAPRTWPEAVVESPLAVARIKAFFDRTRQPLLTRALRRMLRLLGASPLPRRRK